MPTLKSKEMVDQVFRRGRGWMEIKPTPLHQLWRKKHAALMQIVSAVHFADLGDHSIYELAKGGR